MTTPTMSNVPMYLKPTVCKACGGRCCKDLGGAAIPDDIIRNFGGLLSVAVSKALCTGDWVIDWWEGDPRGFDDNVPTAVDRGYYVRPRSEGDGNDLLCPSWGGRCLLLTETGCKLSPELRPWACRILEPIPDGKCVSHSEGKGAKRSSALAWLDYHELLLNTIEAIEQVSQQTQRQLS